MAKILVIDDDAGMRTVLEKALKSEGHQVDLAVDGKEGVKRYLAEPADLVITDLFMPNQEGLETIIELRKQHPKLAIIAMSGNIATKAMLSVAQRLGAVGILEKPFPMDQLHAAVAKALRSGSGPANLSPKKKKDA
jgi:DNA-binding NtrC family response regulator